MTSFTDLVDVAAERLGGVVLFANDEFFAPKENLLKAATPVWREGEYTDRGKWMDGWETRRRRTPGHDWCVIRLGVPALVRGMVVDTSFFRGNYPEACSLDGAWCEGDPAVGEESEDVDRWKEILPRSPLRGDAENAFPIGALEPMTHLRFHIYPDGGVARLRVFGEPIPDPALVPGSRADLAALRHGGRVVGCSDMFFSHRHHLILPGYATSMADGWETRRRRGPGHDWIVIRLARRGAVETIELDTDHFKGNAPESCWLEVCDAPGDLAPEGPEEPRWITILPRTPLRADARHRFTATEVLPATHARLSIHPDGGVARLRLYGTVAASAER